MSRAQDLFNRLRNRGCDALEEIIIDREPESLFLDFKRSPDNGINRKFSDDDNKNLAKAISGFGNSAGGVVIWGVDCRRDPVTNNEVSTKYPLANANGFNTKLQAAISRTTFPVHPGVEVISFDEPRRSPEGYVAVLIPQSFIGPIRSTVSNHYHMRTGSDFGIVPHDVLAGMFGRAPHPDVEMNLLSHWTTLDSRQGYVSISLGIVAVNLGAVICERPYLSASIGDLPQENLHVQAPAPKEFLVRRGPLPTFSVVSVPGVSLVPGATEHLCDVLIDVLVGQPKTVRLECVLGVFGAPPKRFTLLIRGEVLGAAIERAKTGRVPSADVVELIPNV